MEDHAGKVPSYMSTACVSRIDKAIHRLVCAAELGFPMMNPLAQGRIRDLQTFTPGPAQGAATLKLWETIVVT